MQRLSKLDGKYIFCASIHCKSYFLCWRGTLETTDSNISTHDSVVKFLFFKDWTTSISLFRKRWFFLCETFSFFLQVSRASWTWSSLRFNLDGLSTEYAWSEPTWWVFCWRDANPGWAFSAVLILIWSCVDGWHAETTVLSTGTLRGLVTWRRRKISHW